MTEQTKTCTKCGVTKALDAFGKEKRGRDGHRSRCKACVAAYDRKYNAGRPEVWWSKNYRSRARRYGFEPVEEPFTKDDVIERYGDACFYYGWGDFERLDHFIPVKAGGTHTLENVRPSCSADDQDKYLTPGPDYEANQLEQSKARHPAMGGAR